MDDQELNELFGPSHPVDPVAEAERREERLEELRARIAKQPFKVENYFGGCPSCGDTDGFFNIGRDHYFACDHHRTRWCIGSNLFSCWRDENEEIWAENRRKFADYEDVEPLICTEAAGEAA